MKIRVISATEFRAKCFALLGGIDRQGGTVTVTKRGRPIVMVGPVRTQRLWKSSEGLWVGKLHIPEELLTADRSELWEALLTPPPSRAIP
jgi:antitoxin (DNA-binding transcriptional repressor) of toxin-antitoxin stability system